MGWLKVGSNGLGACRCIGGKRRRDYFRFFVASVTLEKTQEKDSRPIWRDNRFDHEPKAQLAKNPCDRHKRHGENDVL